MLRLPACTSSLADLSDGSFQTMIPCSIPDQNVETLLMCSGKIYYEIMAAIEEKQLDNVGVMRIEQLYPLHEDVLTEMLGRYRNARRVAWVQEEPKNMGPWPHLHTTLIRALGTEPEYCGRHAK